MARRSRIGAWVGLALVTTAVVVGLACTTTLEGTLSIITGPDDGFAQSPRPTSLTVQLLNTSGGPQPPVQTLATLSLPGDAGVTLPAQSSTNIDILQITGFDDAGNAVVSGSTIPLALDQLSGITLDLFVQRTGQFSRLPSGDGGAALLSPPASTKPLLTTLFSRYLLVADGTGQSSATQLYDTLTWQLDPAPPPLPMNPLSLAFVSTYTGTDASIDAGSPFGALLTLGQNGAATWLNLTASTGVDASTYEASVPDGGSLAEVAGGQTIVDSDDGSLFVVGGTRLTGKPTSEVLHISPSGVLEWISLTVARRGAAAAYFPSQGLYVFGGNPTEDAGPKEPGAELVMAATGKVVPLTNVPTDTTSGAGAGAVDFAHVLLAGGVSPTGAPAPTRLFTVTSLGRHGDAGPVTASLPVTLQTAQVFSLASDAGYAALVIGSEPSGTTLAYKVTAQGATPVQFRVGRSHAQGIPLPNGSIAVVGGDAAPLESFIP
jgi:hypothetical protein